MNNSSPDAARQIIPSDSNLPEIPADLDSLAVAINQSHEKCQSAQKASLAHAMECGQMLIAAKHKVAHGEWLDWLSSNCTVSVRHAQTYMQIARSRRQIEKMESDALSNFSLRAALDGVAVHAGRGPGMSLAEADEHLDKLLSSPHWEMQAIIVAWKMVKLARAHQPLLPAPDTDNSKCATVAHLLPGDPGKRLMVLEAIVNENFVEGMRVAVALRELRERNLWRKEQPSWDAWCRASMGLPADSVDEIISMYELVDRVAG